MTEANGNHDTEDDVFIDNTLQALHDAIGTFLEFATVADLLEEVASHVRGVEQEDEMTGVMN